ncbi:MAG: hypothetical protein AAB791_00290, partial [Patescibacteria group bacterium]
MFKILIVFFFLISSPAIAATSSGSVDVTATIPGGGSPPIVGNNNNALPVTTLQIVPALGSMAQDCGQVAITWRTQLVTTGGGATQITDQSASTELGYGINSDHENIINGNPGINHSVVLNGLIVGQTYRYYVRSVSGSYERSNYGGSFLANCLVRNPTIAVDPINKGAEIRITYPEGEDIARVIIRRSRQSPPASPTQGESFYDGEKKDFLTDPLILRDQAYWYTAFVCNSLNACSSGVFDSAQRTVSEVGGLAVFPADKRLNLSWSNPEDNPGVDFSFGDIRLIRPSGDCNSARETDGQILLAGRQSSFNGSGLANNQNYQYKIFVKNSYGEYSSGLCINGTPQPGRGYCPENMNISAGDARVDVAWTNPVNQEGIFHLDSVQWQKDAVCQLNKSQGRTVYSGLGQSLADTDVVNGTAYSYAVFVNYNNSETMSCGCVSAIPTKEEEPELCPECQQTEQSPKFNFFVNSGGLEIEVNNENQLWILSGYNLTVKAIRSLLPKPVSLIAVRFNGENYFLSPDDRQDVYQTTLAVPEKAGDYTLTITTVYQDETVAAKRINFKVAPWGKIYAGKLVKTGIKGAQAYLKQNGELFFSSGMDNPVLTTTSGHYGFMAPNGEYELEIKADGYSVRRQKISVKNNIVNFDIDLSEG